MWIARRTKLLTCIAAMQFVERGLLELDMDVRTVLEELKGLAIIAGFDNEGKPVLKKSTKTLTLGLAK